MPRPVVAFVGRPNVGKSSLFNRILGRRKALVQDTPGVTRDRNYALGTLDDREVILCDTGGFEEDVGTDQVADLVREQALVAIEESDVIVLIMDIRAGLTPTDEAIARRLRAAPQPVLYVLNKCDHSKVEDQLVDFYRLGVDEFLLTSAEHSVGLDDLVDAVLDRLPGDGQQRGVVPDFWDDARPRRRGRKEKAAETRHERGRLQFLGDDMLTEATTRSGPEPRTWDPEAAVQTAEGDALVPGVVLDDDGVEVQWGSEAESWIDGALDEDGVPPDLPEFEVPQDDAFVPRIAVLGRPNVGKSTLTNRLLGFKRSITSPVAGTTHDPVDAFLEHEDDRYVLIDMPGLRKRRRITADLEKLFAGRAVRTIEAAHICLLVVDATEGVTEQEARLGKIVVDRGRALVLIVNKWDTQGKGEQPRKEFLSQLRRRFPHLAFADVLFISALTGRGVHRIWASIARADESHGLAVGTAPLNRWLQAVLRENPPPMHKHRPIRIYYGAQVGVRPPTFRFFCRMPQALSAPYKRFMVSRFRAAFECPGTPIRFQFRDRSGR